MKVSYYDILGVQPDADQHEIKQAWREAADQAEPGSGGSSVQFRLVNEAAEVLLDPKRRREYDAELVPAQDRDGDGPTTTVLPPKHEQTPAVREERPDPPRRGASVAPTTGTEQTKSGGVPSLVLGVLGLLAAVAIGVATYLFVESQQAEAYQEATSQAPAAAERAAVAVLAYDYETLDADRDAASKFLTEDYRAEYTKTFNELVSENASKLKAKVEAEVLASSAMVETETNRDPERIRVLMFVNQTTLSAANPEPQVALNRVQFDMVQVDDAWLVDDITSY